MSKPKLTNADFCRAAKRLKADVAAIKAVAQVESAGNGFLADGRCIILFERHHFAKHTRNKFNRDYPQISSTKAGGYYGKEKEYQRFNAAFALDSNAAMKSASWGKFQILGSNHAVCGYSTVGQFVDAQRESEGKQLDAFCGFVEGNNLTNKLRNLDWAGFARGYNGRNYKINNYDTKMATAFRKFAKEGIDCSNGSAATSATPGHANGENDAVKHNSEIDPNNAATQAADNQSQPDATGTATEATATKQTETATGTETVSVTTGNEQDVNETVTQPGPEKYNGIGFKDTIIGDAKAVLPANVGLQTASDVAQQASSWPEWIGPIIAKLALIVLVVSVGWVLYRVIGWLIHSWRENERQKLTALINTDVTRKNIEIKK